MTRAQRVRWLLLPALLLVAGTHKFQDDLRLTVLSQLSPLLCGTSEILEDQGSSWACIATPTDTLWNNIGDAGANGSILMFDFTQTINWNSPSIGISHDHFTIQFDHDAATDSSVQRGFIIARVESSGTAVLEDLVVIENLEGQALVENGLSILANAGGMTNALFFGTNLTNLFKTPSGGLITGAEVDRLDGLAGIIVTTVAGAATDLVCTTCVSIGELADNSVSENKLVDNLIFNDGDRLDLSAVNVSSTVEGLVLPQNSTGCVSGTAEGQTCWGTTDHVLTIGTGGGLARIGSVGYGVGGTGTNSFTYAGQDSCTVDQCRGGVCSATAICKMNLNSWYGNYPSTSSGHVSDRQNEGSTAIEFDSFTMSSGTLFLADLPNANMRSGAVLYIRVKGDFTFTGGKIDLRERGARGSVGGALSGTLQFGKPGEATKNCSRGEPGSGGPNPPVVGSVGCSLPAAADMFQYIASVFKYPWVGGGGGAHSTTVWNPSWWENYGGATGGGGGGCEVGSSGNIGIDLSSGGGFVIIEVGGAFNCTSGTFDVEGEDGATGHAGGGGGSVLILYNELTADTCTYLTDGGTGSISIDLVAPDTCATNGAGGNGVAVRVQVPR